MTAAVCALASGVLFGVSARLQAASHWAAFVALAPWFFGLRRASRRAALASAVLLAMTATASVYWTLPAAMAAYGGGSTVLEWVLCLALAPFFLEPQFLAAALARELGGPVTLAYVAAEWALPRLFPDTIGYALYPSETLRQAGDLAASGRALTLACVAVSALVARAVAAFADGRRLPPGKRTGPFKSAVRGLVAAACVVAALKAYGLSRHEQKPQSAFTAGVVQADITAYDKLAAEQGAYETVRQILDEHERLSQTLGQVDLLVWPETVYPTTFGAPKSDEGAQFDARIATLARRTPLVFGAFEASGEGEHNAAFFLQPGKPFRVYRKSLLFPLTEHVPSFLEFVRQPWMGHWQPGPGPLVIAVQLANGAEVRVAPLICYEALAAGYVAKDARDGAQVLLTLSNDAWFENDVLPRLHLTLAAFRSIETRLPMVRATNSGISALILPSGDIRDEAAFGTRQALRLTVPLAPAPRTLAVRFGDWLGPVCLLLAAAGAFRRRLRGAAIG